MTRFLLIILALFVSLVVFGQKKQPLRSSDFSDVAIDEQWIVVKFKDHSKAKKQGDRVMQDLKLPTQTPSILDGMVKVKLKKGEDPISKCNEFLKDDNVLYAEPVIHDKLLFSPTDPLIESQYYLDNIQAYDAWEITRGDDDIAIAIIDSGVDMDHEDLISNLWINEDDPIDGVDNDGNGYIDDYRGYDFADDDNNPESDQNDHGASVAGIAGATPDNGIGVAGIGFNTKVAALKGFRSADGLSMGLFDAILYAADNGIQVLNLSWGSIREPLQSEQDIIDYAVLEKDVVITAAAGNDGNKSTAEEKFYPASYNNVLSVAGSDVNDSRWSGSSYNYAVDIIAPAAGVASITGGNGYNTSGRFGTSFASPMVAATAALVKDQFPMLSAEQIMERIRVTTDDIYSVGGNASYDGKLGKGRLNVYRAVTETGVKSLRIEDYSVTGPHSDSYFSGDTVTIQVSAKSYLNSLSDPSIYVSDPESDNFILETDAFFPGTIGTEETKQLTIDVILSEDLSPSSNVPVRFDFSDGQYNDFQFLELTTAPDWFDFGNDNLNLTVSGNGDLGPIDYSEAMGAGLIYAGDTLLTYTGVLFATDPTNVSDNIIIDYTAPSRSNDFLGQKPFKLYHHPGADLYGYSEFSDPNNNLLIEQSAISWHDEDLLIIRYRVINNDPDLLSNLYFGVYADWDLDDPDQNTAQWDVDDEYLYVRNGAENLFAATKILGSGTALFSALDLANENGNTPDINGQLSDEIKYDFLVNQSHASAGVNGSGNDVASLHGVELIPLAGYDDTYIDVIYTAANSLAQLENNFAQAETLLSQFDSKPRVLETFFTCDGNVIIDPTAGTNFDFYEDAQASILITSGESYTPPTLAQDTAFFVKNRDGDFSSDVFEVRVRLLNEIADFQMSTDTLYLDHPTTNVVTFTDTSLDAISWLWNFDQGTSSTIQHPTVVFSTPGSYEVKLSIENAQGCLDEITKTLVVADRPASPIFDDFLICPGENVMLSDPAASALKVFSTQVQTNAVLMNEVVTPGPFYKDTTIYVASVVGGFESTRTAVHITVCDFEADFQIITDTLEALHQLRLVAEAPETATLHWLVNDLSSGTAKEITLEATNGITYHIELEVAYDNCLVSVSESFKVSTSPTASASDQVGCPGEQVTLRPQNGTYFGFYEDESLTQLISKGAEFRTETSQRVYVVGLDDGLPGMPIEIDITFESFDVAIQFESSEVGNRNRVALTAESDTDIEKHRWYVNGEMVESSSSPTLYFANTESEVVLEATSKNGCIARDTLLLDFNPPLGIPDSQSFFYPNPATDKIFFQNKIKALKIFSLSGQMLIRRDEELQSVDLGALEHGVYLIQYEYPGKKRMQKLVLE
ncbi:MAG: hypothetical protein Tsb0034_12940 [Ekhidna sp.]